MPCASGLYEVALADLARLRQGAYRLFSQGLLYPEEERLEGLAITAEELSRRKGEWASFAFFPQWDRLLRSLRGLRQRDATAIQGEYVSAFVVNSAGVPCPIYESAYLGEDPSGAGWLMARLGREYAEAGLSPVPHHPPDHAAVELEFMSFLCRREAAAWEGEDLTQARQLLQREHSFLRHHLAWWFPAFARRVEAYSGRSVFANICRAAVAFLVHDADLVGALLERFQGID